MAHITVNTSIPTEVSHEKEIVSGRLIGPLLTAIGTGSTRYQLLSTITDTIATNQNKTTGLPGPSWSSFSVTDFQFEVPDNHHYAVVRF